MVRIPIIVALHIYVYQSIKKCSTGCTKTGDMVIGSVLSVILEKNLKLERKFGTSYVIRSVETLYRIDGKV